jgi:hypothetical protein
MNRPKSKAIVRMGKGGTFGVWNIGSDVVRTASGDITLTPNASKDLIEVTTDPASVELLYLGVLAAQRGAVRSSTMYASIGFARGDDRVQLGAMVTPAADGQSVVMWADGSTSTMSKGGKFPDRGRWRPLATDPELLDMWCSGATEQAEMAQLVGSLEHACKPTGTDDAVLSPFGALRESGSIDGSRLQGVTTAPLQGLGGQPGDRAEDTWESEPTTISDRPTGLGEGVWTASTRFEGGGVVQVPGGAAVDAGPQAGLDNAAHHERLELFLQALGVTILGCAAAASALLFAGAMLP